MTDDWQPWEVHVHEAGHLAKAPAAWSAPCAVRVAADELAEPGAWQIVPSSLVAPPGGDDWWRIRIPLENMLTAVLLVPVSEQAARQLDPLCHHGLLMLCWVDPDDGDDDERGVLIEDGVAVRQSTASTAGELEDLAAPTDLRSHLRKWGSLAVTDSAFLAQERLAPAAGGGRMIEAPPMMICGRCRRPLATIVYRDDHGSITGHDVAHEPADLPEDHRPEPIVRDGAPSPISRCDFCSASSPRWAYPAGPFPYPGLDGATYWSQGAWAACQACSTFVETGDYAGLAGRAARMFGDDPNTHAAVAVIAASFRAARTGPRETLR